MFRLLLPRRLDGFQLEPSEFVTAMELLGAIDGSVAWCVCQALGCSTSAAHLAPAEAAQVFGPPDSVLAWGIRTTTRAVTVDGGYRVSGTWRYVSGIHHATWLGGDSPVYRSDGSPLLLPNGAPQVLTFLFPVTSASIVEVWNAIGLRATGTDTFSVEDVLVPHEYTFTRIQPSGRRDRSPLYALPLTFFYSIGFAGVVVGIARAMLSKLEKLAQTKIAIGQAHALADDPLVQSHIGKCTARLGAAHSYLILAAEQAWADAQERDELTVGPGREARGWRRRTPSPRPWPSPTSPTMPPGPMRSRSPAGSRGSYGTFGRQHSNTRGVRITTGPSAAKSSGRSPTEDSSTDRRYRLSMKTFAGRTAVVTGAASGIGLGMCRRFSREGMNVVMADIEGDRLTAAGESLSREGGGGVLALPTDVSDFAQLDRLATKATEAFGTVHVLCNNAGVLLPNRPIWQNDGEDWKWLMGVNLWGVVHGLQAFLPGMIAAGEEGHVVNTASAAGLYPVPGIGPYVAAKHAVTGITEVLDLDLRKAGSRLGVSLLCPGPVASDIAHAARNRPGWKPRPGDAEALQTSASNLATGLHPDRVGDLVFDAIRAQRFYVFTDESTRQKSQQRAEAIRSQAVRFELH